MSIAAGQLFIVGISGKALSADEKDFLRRNGIGGVVLFARNIENPKQLRELTREIQTLAAGGPPLFVGIDMEGGRVARLKQPFTEWPPAARLGAVDSPNLSFLLAQAMGTELRAVGINLDFAPCLDIFTNPANTVIGDRAIASDPELVAKHATALVRGFLKAGVLPCGKHFPGHGNTLTDSHHELPVEKTDLARLDGVELVPFRKAFKAHLDMVMTSHILFENVDPANPVTFSAKFLKQLLRDTLKYRGLVISDDLGMNAITKHHAVEEIPLKALRAGVDVLLYCNEPEVPAIALAAVNKAIKDGVFADSEILDRHKRIVELKKRVIPEEEIDWETAEASIGCAAHAKIAEAVRTGVLPEGPLV